MKASFKSEEIAHVWANKAAPHGTSPGAMSFEGPAFYSYGTVIARHIERKGQLAAIVNDGSHSVSTSKHQNMVQAALSGRIFYAGQQERGSSLEPSGAELFAYALEKAAECQKQAKTARTRGSELLAESATWLERAAEVNEFFGLRRKVDGAAIDRLRKQTAKAERARLKLQAEKDAKERARQQSAFNAWLKNGESEDYFTPSLFPVAFRVEGNELVSTMGARVSLKDARRAYRFATSRRSAGWHRNGETCPVGNYSIEAINEQGVVAGCHRITWAEIERLAPILAK